MTKSTKQDSKSTDKVQADALKLQTSKFKLKKKKGLHIEAPTFQAPIDIQLTTLSEQQRLEKANLCAMFQKTIVSETPVDAP